MLLSDSPFVVGGDGVDRGGDGGLGYVWREYWWFSWWYSSTLCVQRTRLEGIRLKMRCRCCHRSLLEEVQVCSRFLLERQVSEVTPPRL